MNVANALLEILDRAVEQNPGGTSGQIGQSRYPENQPAKHPKTKLVNPHFFSPGDPFEKHFANELYFPGGWYRFGKWAIDSSLRVSPELMALIAKRAGPLLPPDTIQQLTKLLAQEKHAREIVLAHTAGEARRKRKTEIKSLSGAIEKGEASEDSIRSRDDYIEAYAATRKAAKDTVRSIREAAHQLRIPAYERLRDSARDLAIELDSRDRSEAERLGLAYQPTGLVRTLARFGLCGWNEIDTLQLSPVASGIFGIDIFGSAVPPKTKAA